MKLRELSPASLAAWWRSLTLWQRLLPGISALLIVLGFWALGGLREDHVRMAAVILILGYSGRGPRRLLAFLVPLILTGIVYDSQRFYSDLIRAQVRVEEPYKFDQFFFGIETPTGRMTPNEWWQLHTHWALDLVTGFYYLAFIPIFVCLAAWFTFFTSVEGAGRMMWAFFWCNVLGYTTYYWYPAAPPWYVALHGLGPARMDTLPNAAGCIRFDELLGTRFFTEMYGRSADVFGAIPSLHVAYPLIAVWYAMRWKQLRGFSWSFYLIMCFSAVYLNHHYVLDLIWGSTYALIVTVVTDYWFSRRRASGLSAS